MTYFYVVSGLVCMHQLRCCSNQNLKKKINGYYLTLKKKKRLNLLISSYISSVEMHSLSLQIQMGLHGTPPEFFAYLTTITSNS